MSGRYLLDTNIAILILNREVDNGLILATRDHHFEQIAGLQIEGW
jgi:predicted nucleic acid-binding protein